LVDTKSNELDSRLRSATAQAPLSENDKGRSRGSYYMRGERRRGKPRAGASHQGLEVERGGGKTNSQNHKLNAELHQNGPSPNEPRMIWKAQGETTGGHEVTPLNCKEFGRGGERKGPKRRFLGRCRHQLVRFWWKIEYDDSKIPVDTGRQGGL